MTVINNSAQSETQRLHSGAFSIALTLLVVSVMLNIVSAYKISALRKIIDRSEWQLSLQEEAKVPEIVGIDSNGSPVSLHYGDVSVPTVLYVFTPQCGWCKKNLANFHALIDQASNRYRVVGIALTRQDLDSYLQEQNIRALIYSDIRSDIRDVYRLGGTPETIVVSPAGKVLKVWHGAYQADTKRDIESFLHIRLPDTVNSQL